ncbi:glycine cleavage system H protein (lipoate-binding) [Levilactobacillus mulengensis]|uniref:glycine cleavage system H protein (lipoate-binding) n=1 Tax=Levilactobacillus mulengensis TaxID=2486025 RepID=UPI000F7A4E20|nr:glycine cleavage system H protein (lipoate-binding) [Levilactobacillus mulengensis]
MIDRIEASADALWLTPDEEGRLRLGFADDGRELVGAVTRISWLVTAGRIKLGTPFMVVHGEREDLTLRSPFAGRIQAINQALEEHPERLNEHNDALDWMIELVDE